MSLFFQFGLLTVVLSQNAPSITWGALKATTCALQSWSVSTCPCGSDPCLWLKTMLRRCKTQLTTRITGEALQHRFLGSSTEILIWFGRVWA